MKTTRENEKWLKTDALKKVTELQRKGGGLVKKPSRGRSTGSRVGRITQQAERGLSLRTLSRKAGE